MSAPKLTQRIQEANLSPAVQRVFTDALVELVGASGVTDPSKTALIERLVGNTDGEAAPFEALWAHAELFLTACLYVALADGQYKVEEARHVSHYAHQLGLSARQLAQLEADVFAELRQRGADSIARERGVALEAEGAPAAPIAGEELPVAVAQDDDLTEPGGLASMAQGSPLSLHKG